MIYNHVSLKNIVGRIFNTYNIKSADFINRVPQWTGEALGKLNIYMALEPAITRIEVNEYKAILPSTLKKLVAVEYNGLIIPRLIGTRLEYVSESGFSSSLSESKHLKNIEYDQNGVIISVRTEETTIPVTRSSEYNYILHKNGYIDLPFETGELTIYFQKLPEESDPQTGMYFPLVPDDENVQEAITWYILMNMLYRGYIHPILSLTSANRYINPGLQWDYYKPIARNSASSPDREQRELHSAIWGAVVLDADQFENSFSNKIIES